MGGGIGWEEVNGGGGGDCIKILLTSWHHGIDSALISYS